MSQGCFDRIIFFSPPHATNLFPLTSSSRIFRPRSSNLLGCHLWSYIYCCLSAVCSSSTFPLPCCFPHPCSSPCWPEPDFGVVTGLPLDPRCDQEISQFLGHFCHKPNAIQGGADLSSGWCWSRHTPCRLSPLWFQPQTHIRLYSRYLFYSLLYMLK